MSKESNSIFDLFFKDPVQENKKYLNIIIELVKIMDDLEWKYKAIYQIIFKIFEMNNFARFLSVDTIVLGFFYMFIFKDFVIREIVFKFSETV